MTISLSVSPMEKTPSPSSQKMSPDGGANSKHKCLEHMVSAKTVKGISCCSDGAEKGIRELVDMPNDSHFCTTAFEEA